VVEVVEVLRCWLSGAGYRRVAALAGVDRKTVRRYVDAAVAAGLDREGGVEQLTDELIGSVVAAVRPDRPQGHGAVWEALCGNHARIEGWVKDGLSVVKMVDLLAREGVLVPQRTLHRYCQQRTEYRGRRRGATVPVADGEPGMECQIDFARMGMIFDSEAGRRRVVHALIFTAVYSRHMFVWLTFSQTLEAIVAGCEAAWRFFGGVFKVLIPDNMKPIVAKSDTVNPQLTVGSPERISSIWPTPKPAPKPGVRTRPGCASTAPPARNRRRCLTSRRRRHCCPRPTDPMPCRSMSRSKSTATTTCRSIGLFTPFQNIFSGNGFPPAPTRNW
jgi:hypothetical protein